MSRGEVQKHGFKFEDWLKKTFFDIYYTSEWDIPAELNPVKEGGPISIKTAKWKSSIYFGDACARFRIDKTYTLIVGFWKKTADRKRIVKITESIITANYWRSFWGGYTEEAIRQLDRIIKNRDLTPDEARAEAQKFIASQLRGKRGIISLHSKIDSKTQRRLQCSIPFTDFFDKVTKTRAEEDETFNLWGRKIEPPLL
jgi:hypothetical protein